MKKAMGLLAAVILGVAVLCQAGTPSVASKPGGEQTPQVAVKPDGGQEPPAPAAVNINVGQVTLLNTQDVSLISCIAVIDLKEPDIQDLARRAVAEAKDPEVNQQAIGALRDLGPRGLAALQTYIKSDLSKVDLAAGPDSDGKTTGLAARIKTAVDDVAQQCDASTSGLYWYTDLEKAKQAAQLQGKPILSLRLLGKLRDEMSCANSRYFRSVLYANAAVSQVLREKFILHWESERPVPVITIDFGDGRKIERTITGNSIHYVLDSSGRVVDALPGLYGPAAFLRELEEARLAATALAAIQPVEARVGFLQSYHQRRLGENQEAWNQDVARAGLQPQIMTALAFGSVTSGPQPAGGATPAAAAAGRLAIGKYVTEMPIVTAMAGTVAAGTPGAAATPGAAPAPAPAPTAAAAGRLAFGKGKAEMVVVTAMADSGGTAPAAGQLTLGSSAAPVLLAALRPENLDDAGWEKIAALHGEDARLDAASVKLIASKEAAAPSVTEAVRTTAAKADVESPVTRVIANFQHSIALDTVHNEYQFHATIHQWLASGEMSNGVELAKLNEKVYAELFLTPRSDPWLGLSTPDAYTALPGGGLKMVGK